jgi:hypothetical protein
MTIKLEDGTFECSICHTNYGGNVLYADACEKSHDIIYVPMKKEEIRYFIQYLFTGERKMLEKCQGVIETMMKLVRGKD